MPSTSALITVPFGTSSVGADPDHVRRPAFGEPGLDRVAEPLAQRLDRDLVDQLGEEAADHQPARLVLRDAPGHQVEQLLVVEAAGRAGVAGAGDLAGLDLQVGYRVGPRAVGEQQVPVDLVRVGAGRLGPDQHVADPDGVRVVALQRAPVADVAAAVGHGVVDQQAVLQVLAGVGEVEAVQLGLAAPAGVLDAGVLADQVAAEGDLDVRSPWRRGRAGTAGAGPAPRRRPSRRP